MKKLYLIFFLLLFIDVNAGAQVQSWPPGGITPSPYALVLPANRFVPSTKRFNLVWADQFFGQPTGKIEFIAKNYVGTQKIFSYQADDYRAFNPNFLVISYHLTAGLNPHINNDCPDPKTNSGNGYIGVVAPLGFVSEWDNYFLQWLGTSGITKGSSRYEKMFQHYDLEDTVHRVWHSDPYWLMNLDNTDWKTYMGDVCTQWMSGNQNEGCFLDVSVETMVSPLYNPNSGDPVPYNFNWYISPHGPYGYAINTLTDFANYMNSRYLQYYQYIYQRFHTGTVDYLVMPNTDQMVTGWYDPTWTDGNISGEAIDGGMMENFGSYTGSDMYFTLERGLRHLTGRGKILIAQCSPSSTAERYRRAGMYMLIKNENSFLNFSPGSVDWYPEYEIDLGDQSAVPANINSLRVSGSGSNSLFKRDYTNGIVLCNTSTSPISYSLSGTDWSKVTTTGGGTVDNAGKIVAQSVTMTPVSGSVTVNASDCMILKQNSVTSVNSSIENEFTLIYNQSLHELSIKTNGRQTSADVFIYDLEGRKVKEILNINLISGNQAIKIPVEDLSKGLYILSCGGRKMKIIN